MKKIILLLLISVSLYQCEDSPNKVDEAILKACDLCAKKPSEMRWLRQAMLQSETESPSTFKMATLSDTTVIIQQPYVSSGSLVYVSLVMAIH